MKALMRFYSYIFHGLLALFLLAVAVLAWLSGTTLHMDMLPWKGPLVNYVLLGGAAFGLLSLLLALKGSLRFLFFLWSVVVCVLMVKGFFLSPYHFEGTAGFKTAAWLTVGALAALIGAWFQMTRKQAKN